MTSLGVCGASADDLLAWWLGELEGPAAESVEEHLFACGDCAAKLHRLIELGEGVRAAVRAGQVGFVASTQLVQRWKDAGLTVREYALRAGGRSIAVSSHTSPSGGAPSAAVRRGTATRIVLLPSRRRKTTRRSAKRPCGSSGS